MPRIIAGIARGRRLVAPRGSETRPTSDRAREGLFSSLGDLDGQRVLDLYAGTGAVGLEALSRGAVAAVLVERLPGALAAIRSNVSAVGLPGAVVVAGPVEETLRAGPGEHGGPFDVVFCDPPYAEAVDTDLQLIADGGWVVDGALVVVERDRRTPSPAWPAGFIPGRDYRYGEASMWTALWYLRAP